MTEEKHHLERNVTETRRKLAMVYREGGEINLTEQTGGELISIDNEGRWECSCGESFNKDKTALQHLHKTDSLEDQYDRVRDI